MEDAAESASDVPPDKLLETLDSLRQARVIQMQREGRDIYHIDEWKVRKAGEEWRVDCSLIVCEERRATQLEGFTSSPRKNMLGCAEAQRTCRTR